MLKEPYHFEFEASMNAHRASSLRERAAFIFRHWADRLDGRHTVAYRIKTEPELPPRAIGASLYCGAHTIARALETECKAASDERLFRRVTPACFFEDEK